MPSKRTPPPPGPLEFIAVTLRRERERANVSLSELARRANVSKSTLSQLEAGAGNPSIETLWALAVALGVPFSRLVAPPPQEVRVIRAGEGAAIRSEQAHFTGTMLSACPPGARRDLYVLHLEPGASRHAQAHIPGSVEHLIVSKGRLRAGPTDACVELGPGDYATFPGDVPHIYEALAPRTVAVMVMEHVHG
ncbi:helix-turn-helix domain-containing protein [Corallococcus silvisoli]|uniref:helix-turn-helix domain-containing protein n=1 Tax=Corallococcus silvisoli TaxID=2697031 RepID=UPI0013772EB6|nr:XRE family transcriptional regulator [Corallococcus silvisoli]NBD09218.1 helix-turn-helix domain-containing protein [Corallococcus silvisoli]